MKSLKVNYSKSEYFYLLKRPYTIETLGHFVAGQFGLVTPENELVYVRINGKPSGLALKIKFDGDALTGNARGEGYVYTDDFRGYRNIITRDARYWEMRLEPENTKYIEKYPPNKLIAYFQETLKNQDLATASNLMNIDQLLKWDALSSILGSGHQDSYHNLVLYFDSTRGTFEPIPYDFRYNEEKTFQIDHPLKDFFLSDFRNFNSLYKLIYEYVTDEKKLSELISFSEEYRKKTDGINKILKQTEDLESELNEYINNHQDRINIFKERLSQNSTVQVNVQKVQKNMPQDTSTYQIEVIPFSNEQVSSTVVKGISIKKGKISSVLITDSNGREIENGQMEDYLPSDYFYRRKSENLWKDQYEFIKKQLKPQDAEIFSKAYTPSYAVGMTDEVYTYKLTDPVKGEALLRKIGYIKHPKRLIYYLSIPSESAINVRNDLLITVENSITGELIIPEILSDDSVLNLETQKKSEPSMKIKQAKNSLGLVKYDYTPVGVFLKEYPIFKLDGRQDDAIKLPHGTYDIDNDIIIPANINLTIEPGVTIRFGKNSSLVTYGALNAVGTEGSPIVFTATNKWNGWGVVGIAHTTGSGKFSHCIFEYGNDDYVNGIYFSGMLAAYQAHVEVQNCTFQHANKKSGDDALNFKNSSSFVKNSFFTDNKFDAIDFDFMKGEITSNKFIKNGNDAIDLSKSSTLIAHNYIERSGDKCISVGEASDPTITGNILYKCYIGIIVKDSSAPRVVNNIVAKNKIGIDTYQKKRYFEGGHGTFKNILLLENSRQIAFEDPEGDDRLSTDNSTIDITYSNIPGGYKGEGNIDAAIRLDDLIDSGWQHNLFKQ